MADTLKFGPEWLRALSDGDNAKSSSSSPAGFPAPGFPKYKLAENRYGREEMLALFVPHTKVPEPLLEIPSIVVEKAMHPLAFIPPSEEEQRLLSSSVNSPAVLRLMGRGSSMGERGRGERGRGGVERGRGRGRGRGEGYYPRGSFEEDGFGRGRHIRGESWEESSERPRFERGSFTARASFDEGPPSPRREYSRSMSSDNWREAKKEAAGAGAGPRSSWREPRDRSYTEEGYVENSNFGSNRMYKQRSKSGSWDDAHDPDGLPEWSTADFDDGDDIGTFDSSGAFMSLKEAEELDKMGIKYERFKPKDQSKEGRDSSSPPSEKGREKAEEKKDSPPPKSPQEVPKEKPVERVPSPRLPSEEKRSSPRPANTSNGSQTAKEANAKPRQPKAKETVVNNTSSVESSEPAETHNVNSQGKRSKVNGDIQPRESHPMRGGGSQQPKGGGRPPTRHVEEEADFGHLEQAAENMVATWTAEEDAKQDKKDEVESGGVPMDHEDAKKWFYKDPQGDLQGPFTNAEMSEWFSAGYFTMNLLVKRGCDDTFHSLGELIKRWGRVPFLPGPSPPPLKAGSSGPPMPAGSPGPMPTAMPGMAPPVSAGTPVSSSAVMPKATSPIDPQQQEQMMKIQQQVMMQQQFLQQQALLRQLQLQQVIQGLQQQEGFQKLSAQQQQQLAVNLLMKQQQHAALVQQQQQLQQGPQKLSPRSPSSEAPQTSTGGPPPFQRSMSQPADIQQQQVPRSVSQPGTLDDSGALPSGALPGWGGAGQVPTSGWGTASVWDVEGNKAPQSLEEIQQMEMDHLRREQDEREGEMRRKHEEEEMRQREEERKRKEAEERQRKEAEERQREMERQDMERQKELERMRHKEQERQREMERRQEMERLRLEQQQAEQLRRRQEEAELRRMEEERRHREEERRRQEEEHRRLEEERRLADECRRQQEVEMIEQKRQEEIRRRQVMAANEKAEALRRIQEAQLANIQLPASAQWANSNNQQASVAGLSLAEIQVIEAERERKDQEERKAKMEIQRQQLAAIQQQQQQGRSWAASQSRPVSNTTKSLLEIQQEQARQEQDTMRKQAVQAAQRKTTSVPLSTAAVWGANSSTWASEGAWGNPQTKANLGFWEDTPVQATSNKRASGQNNANFPALNNPVMISQPQVTKSRTKAKKEEETVQRLFQAMKPKDEFTQWCENSLKGMQSSVDIPTFIAFLTDIESPFEVHDYVRSYLGESKDANEFAKQFIEKRSKYRNQLKQQQQEESMWGPAPAITPGQPLSRQLAAAHTAEELSKKEKASKKEKKKKMQKLDAGFLGFTAQPAPDRLVGEIDSIDG